MPQKPSCIVDTVSYALANTCKAHRNQASKVLAEVGLYPGQEMILIQLWQEDGLSQSQLAERLGVQAPTITRMLQRIEAVGLVTRRCCPQDCRISHVYLTEQGQAIQAAVEAAWNQLETHLLAGLNLEERILLRRLLLHVQDNYVNLNTNSE